MNDERKRLEDVNMNSRGLLSPRFLTSAQYWRLQRRESATWIYQTVYVHHSSLKHSSIITAKVDSHAELVSASVRGEALILARGEILKLVQHDL